MKRTLFLFSILALLSCNKDDVQLSSAEQQIIAWLDTMNIDATRDDSGIYYYPEVENAPGSAVTSSDIVAIYYTLKDLEGDLIASHQRTDGDSLIFKHGVNAVYPIGIDVAVGYMKVGETYHFLMPPDQSYADLTSGAINPRLIAHLTLEVVGIESETNILTQELADIDQYIIDQNLNDTVANPLNMVEQFPASGISTKRLVAGFGTLPLNGDTIIVDYVARDIAGSTIDSKTGLQFYFGSNEPRALTPGFEFGVSMMQTNERSLIILPSSQAFKESALVIPMSIAQDLVDDAIIPDYVVKVAAYTTLLFEVTRVD